MSYFKYKNYQIYYNEFGCGKPLVIIHGDTASSKMIRGEAKYYSKFYKVIIVDLIGQGKSKRVDKLPTNYWYDNGLMIIELCKYLKLENINLLGTSGGAITALNASAIEPQLFNKIIADSFIGEKLSIKDAIQIANERKKSEKYFYNKLFWFIMHGMDWRKVIDQNTEMIIEFSNVYGSLFSRGLECISNNVLLTGSMQDNLIDNIEDTLISISHKIKNSKIYLFKSGNHPAMLSNKKEFHKLVNDFLND